MKKHFLRGIAASKGKTEGRVVIILSPKENLKIKNGDILVAQSTNPLFTPAIIQSKGLITEKGGMLCHAAIIARELNIPCVVGVEKASEKLKDGQTVILNGGKGKVYYD